MIFSEHPRVIYRKPQLAEVICQLRFPTILNISAEEPAQFQEAIRNLVPVYSLRHDQPAPKLTGVGTPLAKLEPQPPVVNYHFVSADNKWRLNLTNHFISLSTLAYPGWEEFAGRFDLPLAEFIRRYKPAFFERIGLRYVNIFSRKALEVEGEAWRELIEAPWLGVLSQPDVDEARCGKCSVDVDFAIDNSCRAKIHAGTGVVKINLPGASPDPELKFIFDMI